MNVSKSIMQKLNRAALVFAVCLLTLTSAFALTNGSRNVSAAGKINKLFKPSAVFKDIWVDYDVVEGGENGMRIHVKFTTYGMKNLDSYLAIYFMDSDGEYLRDRNDRFNSSTGDVAVYRSLKPGYETTEYNDLSVFMPYSELDLSDGNWDLSMDVKLIYKAGGIIQELTTKDFNYKQGDTDTKGGISATVKRVWVDYNVTQGGRRGMRIHVNFEVTGLKGVDSKLTVRIRRENDDFLISDSPSYANDEGQLEVSFSMKPGYPVTVYEDATMFLPYDEIVLRKGVWDLRLDIDLNYEDGELIDHLAYHEFEFTR